MAEHTSWADLVEEEEDMDEQEALKAVPKAAPCGKNQKGRSPNSMLHREAPSTLPRPTGQPVATTSSAALELQRDRDWRRPLDASTGPTPSQLPGTTHVGSTALPSATTPLPTAPLATATDISAAVEPSASEELQGAVNTACSEICAPYAKAILALVSQLVLALPGQLSHAAVAIAANPAAHPTSQAPSHAALQKAMLIALAPIQEQLASLQRAMAHVVPHVAQGALSLSRHANVREEAVASTPITVHRPAFATPQHTVGAALAGTSVPSAQPFAMPFSSPALPSSAVSTPGSATPLSFVERARLAAATRAAEQDGGNGGIENTEEVYGGSGGRGSSRQRGPVASGARVKAGHQTYRPSRRQGDER